MSAPSLLRGPGGSRIPPGPPACCDILEIKPGSALFGEHAFLETERGLRESIARLFCLPRPRLELKYFTPGPRHPSRKTTEIRTPRPGPKKEK